MRNLPLFHDANLIVGAEGFSDAGVYRLRADLLLVQSLDFFPPLVDDPFVFGQIAAANSLSDVYAMGGKPVTCLNICAFPDDELDLEILNLILQGGSERVLEAGAVVAGGHTLRDKEVKYGMSVTGVVAPEHLIKNSGAQAGDKLVLTKALGTGFITTAHKSQRCPADVLAGAVASMIQLNRIGCEAARAAGAHASTDITGFGLGGHAGEMAQASGVTAVIEVASLPLLAGARELLRAGYKTRASASNRDFAKRSLRIEETADRELLEFVFDAQTSGGLLLSVPAANAEKCVADCRRGGGTFAAIVGSVTESAGVAVVLR